MTLQRAAKWAVFFAALGATAYALWHYRENPRTHISTLGRVERGDLVVKVTISGIIMPRRHAMITPPYSGYVRKLHVKVGDKVREGAPIVSVAQAVGAAHEEVFPLRSPLAGIVVQVLKKEGEYVGASSSGGSDSTLVRVDDVTKFNVESNVPEVEVGKLKIGLPVVIRAVAVSERTYVGKISDMALAAKEQQGFDRSRVEYPVTITISDQDERIKSGMSAIIDIIVRESRNVLKLPHEFVQKGAGGYFVTTKTGQRQPIEVGLENEEAFEIKSGVVEGEEIRQVDFLNLGGAA